MKVTIDVPDRVWWRASQNAEREGLTVADIAHSAVLTAAGAESLRQIQFRARRQAVIVMARAGATDARIAERTGETRRYIQQTRRNAGIPANRQTRAMNERKTA